jgi:hypothetical protein
MQNIKETVIDLGDKDISTLDLGFDPTGLAQLLLIGTIVSIVLMVLFIVYIIINTTHRWKSERAMIEMQKDIADIADMLDKVTMSKAAVSQETPAVASSDEKSEEKTLENTPEEIPQAEHSNPPEVASEASDKE